MKVKLTDWNVGDYLKTYEDRMAYIEAAAEEGTPDAIPDAFADVFRSLRMNAEAAACEGLANYIRAMPAQRMAKCASETKPRRKAASGATRPKSHRKLASSGVAGPLRARS